MALARGAAVSLGVGIAVALFGMRAEVAAALALTIVLIRRHRTQGGPSWDLALRGFNRSLPETLTLAALFGAGAVALLDFNPPPMHAFSVGQPPGVVLALLVAGLAIVNAVLEEGLWRVLVYGATLHPALVRRQPR